MYKLAQFTAAVTAFLCLGLIFWWVFVRRELFNPMLYVIYGTFHWLVVGQLGTLFLGEEYYEPRGDFLEETHFFAAVVILLSITSGLMGFYAFAPRTRAIVNWHVAPANKRLAWLTLTIGSVSFAFLLNHIKTFSVDEVSFEYSLWALPVTLPYISTAVLGAYLFFRARRTTGHSWLFWWCGILAVLPVLTSNVMVIFAVFAIVFWYLNRAGKVYRAPLGFTLLLTGLVPAVVLLSLFIKILQRPDDIQTVLTIGKATDPNTIAEAFYRFITLDIFNVEDYSLFLIIIERVQGLSDLKWGSSYLAAFLPFLRFFYPDIRGMGRQFAIDEGFGDSNVSFATPPIIELYANFGLPAPIVGYFALGAVLALLYRWYLRTPSENHGVIYLFILSWVLFLQRGDALNTILYPAYILLVILVLLWFAGCRRYVYVKNFSPNHIFRTRQPPHGPEKTL